MTSLHILCRNSRACTDVTGSTTLQLFLKCRGLLGDGNDEQESPMPSSLYNFLDIGIGGEDLAFLLVLNDNQEFVTSLCSEEDRTILFPFMTAATLSSCGLDVVYILTMKNLDAIV